MLQICAIEYVSLSELQTVDKTITKDWIDNNSDKFKSILFSLGCDIYNYPADEQYVCHRNRFGNIVTDFRWVCNSRVDQNWIKSGYASTESKDKSLNNRILTDSYASRGEVEVV